MSKKYLKYGKNIKYYLKYNTHTQKGGSIVGMIGNTVSFAGRTALKPISFAGHTIEKTASVVGHILSNLTSTLTHNISAKFNRMIGMCGGKEAFVTCIAKQSINPAMEASITACIGGGVETLGAACGPAVVEIIGGCCNPFNNLKRNPSANY